MAKRRAQRAASEASGGTSGTDRTPEESGRHAPEAAEIEAAEEGLRRAREELKRARQAYRQVRRQAVDQLKQAREMSLGELIGQTLKQVQKHPGPGVVVAAMIGFFLGRLFRR